MNLSPSQLKRRSADLIRVSQPKAMYVAAVYLLISFVLTELSGRILGVNMSITKIQQYMEHVQSGNLDNALALLQTMSPSTGAYAINLLLETALTVVFAGFNIYLLNLVRGTEASYGNILDGFGIWLKVILLSVLKTIFVSLWSLLLVIPGIIAAISYSMALYILIDEPSKGVRQCLRESKEMMRGHKMEFFLLELSFIGWMILSSFGMAGYIIQIWSLPYMNLCYIMFYENLRLNRGY